MKHRFLSHFGQAAVRAYLPWLLVTIVTLSILPTQAQAQDRLARIGVLSFISIENDTALDTWYTPFHRTLATQGWETGRNLSFEYRTADGDPSRFASAANELVDLQVNLILAVGAPALREAHLATNTIPIVGVDYTTDPITNGYVKSYGRPGGNITGIFLDAPAFAGKWFELLKAMSRNLSRVGVLWDPSPGPNHLIAIRSVASSLEIPLEVVEVRKPEDLEPAFNTLSEKVQAVIILPSPMHYSYSSRLASLALKYQLPATSMAREFAMSGGTISYGPDEPATYRRIAMLAAKILDGNDVGKIPVERPTKLEMAVNLETARTLDITIPQSILLIADEVIR